MKILASTTVLLSLLAVAGCPKKMDAASPGGAAASTEPFGTNMAEAPVHKVPSQIVGKPACNERSYARIDAGGQAFTVAVTVPSGCVMVSGLTDGGGMSAFGVEICADKPDGPKVLEVPAQEGRPMVTVSESGECTGITATLDLTVNANPPPPAS